MSVLLRTIRIEDLVQQHEIAFQRKQLTWNRQNEVRINIRELKAEIDSAATNNKNNSNFLQLQRIMSEHALLLGEFFEARKIFLKIDKKLKDAKAEEKARIERDWKIALNSGVPYQYLDNIDIEVKKDETICISFGGYKKADGPGYGYYIVDINDEVTHIKECSNICKKKNRG